MVFETSIFISRALVLAFLLAVKQGIFHASLFDLRRDSLNSEALREQGKLITSLCWLRLEGLAGLPVEMRVRYNKVADALYIRFRDERVVESEEVEPGVIVDYNDRGEIVGVEVL